MSDPSGRKPPLRSRGPNRRLREFQAIDEIAVMAQGVIPSRHAPRRLLGMTLDRAWARSVGEQVRAVTRPRGLEDGALIVDVLDDAWKSELERWLPEIRERLREFAPRHRIESVTFRSRPDAWRGEGPARRRQWTDSSRCPVDQESPGLSERGGPLVETRDDILRDRLGAVMMRYLRRHNAG